MGLNYEHLMGLKRDADRFSYGERETMLYAIGIGMGRDPSDRNELPYVFEQGTLKTVPTMATVLARIALLKDCGYDYSKVVHGEQRLTLHRPLPPAGELIASARVTGAYDKGPGRGALICTETKVRSVADGQPLFTQVSVTFARGDGGFGGPPGGGPQPHRVPDRAPDITVTLETRRDQALLYRLNGDRNPLHADPDLAKRAGFPVPILHGLCTYGVAGRAILEACCGGDPARLKSLQVRFSAPVFPGETIRTEMWTRGGEVSFRARVVERDLVVLSNGLAQIAA